MKKTSYIRRFGAALMLFALAASVQAEEAWLRPYVMSSDDGTDVAAAVSKAKSALAGAGLELVGEYSPYAGATVLAVSSDALRAAAAKSEFGGYGAVTRVAVTQVGDKVQTSYIEPKWMAQAYRMGDDLSGISAKLAAALGNKATFGAEEPGWKAEQLREYHFMVFMPYFDDHHELGSFDDHAAAVKAVEANLDAGKGGTKKIYKVKVPGKDEVVFGVGIAGAPQGDEHIMKLIDLQDSKQTAHLPWEVLVSGKDVYTLHAKFRIAVNFPDLDMGTFININDAPSAIEDMLTKMVKGE